MTSRTSLVDLIDLDCNFEHIAFDPANHRENGYIYQKKCFKAILSCVL